ncbi:primary-amine oxidase [Streptomyces mutabilis]|uniref:primary-amine oxidase n=1 Tax=Streptomyces mutabilis TaxID=67332 RepID=UPI00367B753B
MLTDSTPPTSEPSNQQVSHPLDPVTAAEITAARDVLVDAGKVSETTRFTVMQLREPPKSDVLPHLPGDPVERTIDAVLIDTATGSVHEAVVSVTQRELLSWTPVDTAHHPYGQPPLVMEEGQTVTDAVRSDPRWKAAMASRGIHDTDLCVILCLPPGNFGHAGETGRRVLRALTFWREHEQDSPWAHPVEGLVASVDLVERRVIELYDYGSAPLPREHGNFREGDWGPPRTTLKPLEITQPEGPSFQVDGRCVSWQNWHFRVGFDQREGLVLHQLTYREGERDRPIIYRASMAELAVPYADPHPARYWVTYFDEGEDLLGRVATSLALGCDCLGVIHYFDAVMSDDYGRPYTAPNVVCMHEEDYGVLWKHTDYFTGVSETRRSRRLVLSTFTAIGNYDYGFFWYLYQDGTIQFEAKLTGILFANAQHEGTNNPHATPVAPGVVAPYHQHLFNMRLDMMVDGVRNTVEEVDVVPLPMGEGNPHGNAFTTASTVLRRESEGARMAEASVSRIWKVINSDSRNRLGQPVAYKLVPNQVPVLLAQPDSPLARRAAFATKHLWVTKYDPAERYAAGDYPNQHAGGSGLPAWQAKDRSLADEDVVLWHTFGTTHIPRPEEWPVMPVEYTGFTLKPVGFFDRNPSLDLPRSPRPEEGGGSCHAQPGLPVTPDEAHHPTG